MRGYLLSLLRAFFRLILYFNMIAVYFFERYADKFARVRFLQFRFGAVAQHSRPLGRRHDKRIFAVDFIDKPVD